jgi:DNA mismatch repair protein MutL
MPHIHRLPLHVVNKIAAGEVIERPASVVKELVENSLDAGASRIDVSVEKGGLELLRVVDNGRGISPEELPLAVEPHATSKIRTADDLFRVATLGFRGEALASIAAVSQFTLRSRPAGQAAGAELALEGGDSLLSVAATGAGIAGAGVETAGEGLFAAPELFRSARRAGDALNDRLEAVAPCGCPEGTSVEVRNLFFNTPVRRKFLKSTQTEIGHISEAIARLALAHPQVHFTLRHNGREIYDLPPTADWRARIARFFGQELADGLIAIERTDTLPTGAAAEAVSRAACRLFGYVAAPTHSRPNNRSQYFFLNGRYIRDRSLQHALTEAYRGLLLTGRYPIAFICFEVPADAVDVNVHPTKLEVRFQDGGRLYSLLLGTLRTKFLGTDLTAHWKPPAAAETESPQGAAAHDPNRADEVRQELVAWAKGQLAGWEVDGAVSPPATSASNAASGGHQPPDYVAPLPSSAFNDPAIPASGAPSHPSSSLRLHKLDGALTAKYAHAEPGDRQIDEPSLGERGLGDLEGAKAVEHAPALSAGLRPSLAGPLTGLVHGGEAPRDSRRALQVHNRYLIAETGDGVLVIDQHALHERILYEQLRAKVLAGAVESQNLLVPEPVDLAPAEAAAVLQERDLLAQLGVRVEPFGGDTVLVTSYPAMLAKVNLLDMLRGIVERLLSGGKAPDRRDLLDELLHMMSCKAAVKAGDRLTPEEIDALLEQRHLAQDTHHCPHGRPTALMLTREELDRQFLRT